VLIIITFLGDFSGIVKSLPGTDGIDNNAYVDAFEAIQDTLNSTLLGNFEYLRKEQNIDNAQWSQSRFVTYLSKFTMGSKVIR